MSSGHKIGNKLLLYYYYYIILIDGFIMHTYADEHIPVHR